MTRLAPAWRNARNGLRHAREISRRFRLALALHRRAAMHAFKSLFAVAVVASLVACSGGPDTTSSSSSSSGSSGSSGSGKGKGTSQDQDDNEPGSTSSSSSSSSSSSGGSSKPSGATNVTCQSEEDCGYWFCDCKDSSGDVSPVNSANCTNGYCLDAAASCPDACAAFGKTWTGTAGGGPEQN